MCRDCVDFYPLQISHLIAKEREDDDFARQMLQPVMNPEERNNTACINYFSLLRTKLRNNATRSPPGPTLMPPLGTNQFCSPLGSYNPLPLHRQQIQQQQQQQQLQHQQHPHPHPPPAQRQYDFYHANQEAKLHRENLQERLFLRGNQFSPALANAMHVQSNQFSPVLSLSSAHTPTRPARESPLPFLLPNSQQGTGNQQDSTNSHSNSNSNSHSQQVRRSSTTLSPRAQKMAGTRSEFLNSLSHSHSQSQSHFSQGQQQQVQQTPGSPSSRAQQMKGSPFATFPGVQQTPGSPSSSLPVHRVTPGSPLSAPPPISPTLSTVSPLHMTNFRSFQDDEISAAHNNSILSASSSLGDDDDITFNLDPPSIKHPVIGNNDHGHKHGVAISRSETENGTLLSSFLLSSDRKLVSEFTNGIVDQMQIATFSPRDRKGKRSAFPSGYIGMSCRHCNGMNGRTGRYFPSSIKTISDSKKSLYAMYKHLSTCKCCPADVKKTLSASFEKHTEDRKKNRRQGTQRAYFRKIWQSLHPEESPPDNY